ncbi:MAG: RNA polymerase sigma factor [Bacteroidota bacterium]
MEAIDKKILKGCLRKDKSAQRQLYERYKVPMFRLCLRYAKDRAEAEDILQDGFIKVFADLGKYRGDGALGGWIRRVILNIALQHVRKQKRQFQTIEIDQIAETSSAEEMVFSQFGARALTKMIQQLPVGYRTVFNLYVVEGYSHKEIAEQLNFTVNTSKSQLSKAKAMLRKMLEKKLIS